MYSISFSIHSLELCARFCIIKRIFFCPNLCICTEGDERRIGERTEENEKINVKVQTTKVYLTCSGRNGEQNEYWVFNGQHADVFCSFLPSFFLCSFTYPSIPSPLPSFVPPYSSFLSVLSTSLMPLIYTYAQKGKKMNTHKLICINKYGYKSLQIPIHSLCCLLFYVQKKERKKNCLMQTKDMNSFRQINKKLPPYQTVKSKKKKKNFSWNSRLCVNFTDVQWLSRTKSNNLKTTLKVATVICPIV